MGRSFIDRFDVILLDMGNTFMFNVDRFSDSEDFGGTYRRVGGKTLCDEEVRRIILAVFNRMLKDNRNPKYYDRFPSVFHYLQTIPESKNLPEGEIDLLERVFAMHEVGTIPDSHAEALRNLHETHRLGLVSNIWAKKDLFLAEFDRVGVTELFETIVFSSDYGCLKPSPILFAKAIESFDVDRSKIVFVGDSLKRDIAGAKVANLAAIWIDRGIDKIGEGSLSPDLVIQALRELVS